VRSRARHALGAHVRACESGARTSERERKEKGARPSVKQMAVSATVASALMVTSAETRALSERL
jgi:hypothetical protein